MFYGSAGCQKTVGQQGTYLQFNQTLLLPAVDGGEARGHLITDGFLNSVK